MTQREKLIELLKNEKCPYNSGLFTDDDVADYLLANGVVVPVRCGECKYCNKTYGGGWWSSEPEYTILHCKCKHGGMHDHGVSENDFCSCGERRSE